MKPFESVAAVTEWWDAERAKGALGACVVIDFGFAFQRREIYLSRGGSWVLGFTYRGIER